MQPLINQFLDFYHELGQPSRDQLAQLYAEEIEFIDPVHTIHGLDALTDYFNGLMGDVSDCRFEIEQVDALAAVAYIRWTMTFRHPRLNGGQPIVVPGLSQLRFAERITYQRDYYDLGAMLYEQLPLFGALVRGIKRRLA